MARFLIALLPLVLLFCFWPIDPVAAQDLPGATKNIQLRNPTEKEIHEAQTILATCQKDQVLNQSFDCECAAVQFLMNRIIQGPDKDQMTLAIESRASCVNVPEIAGIHFQRCVEWASYMRADYEEYCSCYANEYALSFAKIPSSSMSAREVHMTRAMNSCNSVGGFRDREEQIKIINDLKKAGKYRPLFPGARKLSPQLSPLPATPSTP